MIYTALDLGLFPDSGIRFGIRRLLLTRLREEARNVQACGGERYYRERFMDAMDRGPIAPFSEKANEQHYEVPAAFFDLVLGPEKKYSSAYWPSGVCDLGEAEAAMLNLTVERAGIQDGQRILELGCGWGSFTLWTARHFPQSHIVGVSNSRDQRDFILDRARGMGLSNVDIMTSDMNAFSTDRRFDRVVSVEMFEHMRNWRKLLGRVSGWLEADGRLFIHIFTHRTFAYEFESKRADDWMGRHFFTGGIMPSHDLLREVAGDWEIESEWFLDGTHYEKTANAWLANLDCERERVESVFAHFYGRREWRKWLNRWRVFFMACAELWGYSNGTEWGVKLGYVFSLYTMNPVSTG